jgi:hypothetical protein
MPFCSRSRGRSRWIRLCRRFLRLAVSPKAPESRPRKRGESPRGSCVACCMALHSAASAGAGEVGGCKVICKSVSFRSARLAGRLRRRRPGQVEHGIWDHHESLVKYRSCGRPSVQKRSTSFHFVSWGWSGDENAECGVTGRSNVSNRRREDRAERHPGGPAAEVSRGGAEARSFPA